MEELNKKLDTIIELLGILVDYKIEEYLDKKIKEE